MDVPGERFLCQKQEQCSAGVSCDVLHRRQPSGPPLGPQCTGTKEPSEESYGLACLSLVCASYLLGKRTLCREQEQWRQARRPVQLDRQRRHRARAQQSLLRWTLTAATGHVAPWTAAYRHKGGERASRTCPEKGVFVEGRNNGDERGDQRTSDRQKRLHACSAGVCCDMLHG